MPDASNILIVLPDGVGIKNYLHSSVIEHLKSDSKITIWSPLPIEAFAEVKEIHNINFQYKNISLPRESLKVRLLREAITYARLRNNYRLTNNPTILTNWRIPKYSFKAKLLYYLAQIYGYVLGKSYKSIINAEKRLLSKVSSTKIDSFVNDLNKLKPKTIFITHQRVVGLLPLCLAAEKLGIKTVSAIFSWDNLPKARLNVRTSKYLVWSNWMKNEMKTYYPEIDSNQVEVVGTPQFEFYFDSQRILDRKVFAKTYGLDYSKKWICFSGDDQLTSPHDQLFLRDLAESLVTEKEEIQIIFRRCPVDFSSRYDDVLNNFNEIIVSIDPKWNVETETGWTGYFPKYEDINLQVNLAHHCELVTNLGSTMAVDFATLNKPCVYLNYSPLTDNNWSTEVIYNYQHFKSMEGFEAVNWINRKDDIKSVILQSIKHPNTVANDRNKWIKRIVLHPLNENAIKIAKALK